MMLAGGLLLVGFIVCLFYQMLTGPVVLLLVVGILLFLVGLQIASRQPMRLKIVKVEEDLIFIDNIHPDYLDRLPDVSALPA